MIVRRLLTIITNVRPPPAHAVIGFRLAHDTASQHNEREEAMKKLHVDNAAGPQDAYATLVKRGVIHEDAHQLQPVALLQGLHESLHGYEPKAAVTARSKRGLFGSLFQSAAPAAAAAAAAPTPIDAPRGLYMYGSVGCGKTFLMDLFFANVSVERKRRVHFHGFMLEVHARLHERRSRRYDKETDFVDDVATDIARDAWLLCFDELQVTDVADAMILRRLFEKLCRCGVVVVATSNRHPDELYKGGLQRNLFLPFIDLIKDRCAVHHLNSGRDYRRMRLSSGTVFFTPKDGDVEAKMQQTFKKLTGVDNGAPTDILVLGTRKLHVPCAAKGVAWFTFDDLCAKPLGASDYIALSQNFHAVLVSGIPHMSFALRNEARRFITLIDELYEHKVKFIGSAAAPPDQLFQGVRVAATAATAAADGGMHQQLSRQQLEQIEELGLSLSGAAQSTLFTGEDEEFAFKRAVSRLAEMQSAEYLALPHQPHANQRAHYKGHHAHGQGEAHQPHAPSGQAVDTP